MIIGNAYKGQILGILFDQISKLIYEQESCATQRWPRDARYIDREPLRRYGRSKLSKIAAAAFLNLFESKIAPLDPPSPKIPH